MSVIFGCIATGVALLCNGFGSLINMGGTLFGACMGPMFGFTLISILAPCVNLRGSSCGLIVGQLVNIWLSLGSVWYSVKTPHLPLSTANCSMFGNETAAHFVAATLGTNYTSAQAMVEHPLSDGFNIQDLYRMSYNIYPIIGMVLTMVLSVVASLVFARKSDPPVKSSLVHPLAARLFKLNKCDAV